MARAVPPSPFESVDNTLIFISITSPLHNVHFGYYVFLPTEQAETYLKICVLIYHSTYICPSLFGWKENLIFKENCDFQTLGYPDHFDRFWVLQKMFLRLFFLCCFRKKTLKLVSLFIFRH